jgi:hypothetical protein
MSALSQSAGLHDAVGTPGWLPAVVWPTYSWPIEHVVGRSVLLSLLLLHAAAGGSLVGESALLGFFRFFGWSIGSLNFALEVHKPQGGRRKEIEKACVLNAHTELHKH